MQYLIPAGGNAPLHYSINKLNERKPLEPFSEIVIDFISEISQTILLDKSNKNFPELMAMAYWMRKPNILKIKDIFLDTKKNRVFLSKGTVLHYAPSNVDTIFIYSWFLSLLVGNCNAVRLSQKRGDQVDRLIHIINIVISKEKYAPILNRTMVLTFAHEDDINEILSANCDLRVIWGGDDTIRRIRSYPLKPSANEIVFADKFSLAALKLDEIARLNTSQLSELAEKFYHDAYWFDQMACSSPRLVVWVGNGPKDAIGRFWDALKSVIEVKKPNWGSEIGMTRLVSGYSFAARGLVEHISTSSAETPYRVSIEHLDPRLREEHCGGGFFLEVNVTNLLELRTFLTPKEQSLAAFGFSSEELLQFAKTLGGHGVDRIVPIGMALQFQTTWDGYDLLTYFTREINIL